MGKEILIDRLRLPYTHVSVALNELDGYNPGLWNLGKIYTYSIQYEPFLHIDNDVFVFKEFEPYIINAPLVAQNLEKKVPGYSKTFKNMVETFPTIPQHLRSIYNLDFTPSCNAGILGGANTAFFQHYMQEVFSFIKDNEIDIGRLVNFNAGNISVILEQVFFYSLALHYNLDIAYLLPEADGFPPQIGYFHEAKKNKDFVHCVSFFKKDRVAYSLLELKLQQNYPEDYRRINDLIAESEI